MESKHWNDEKSSIRLGYEHFINIALSPSYTAALLYFHLASSNVSLNRL